MNSEFLLGISVRLPADAGPGWNGHLAFSDVQTQSTQLRSKGVWVRIMLEIAACADPRRKMKRSGEAEPVPMKCRYAQAPACGAAVATTTAPETLPHLAKSGWAISMQREPN